MTTLTHASTLTEAEHATIAHALSEDIGTGDVTSQLLPADQQVSGTFIAKADGVVAGLEVAAAVFATLDSMIQFVPLVADGDRVTDRQPLATVSGPVRSVLSGERVALNFMQRMGGIATATRRYVDRAAPHGAKMLDTRKTVPGLRSFDKRAVVLGGGQNHRFGLYDMVLIKENHIRAAGSIAAAVANARAVMGEQQLPIEVEVTNLAELREALPLQLDRIMLDNMSLAEMRAAVAITNGATPLEASGNVTLETVAAIAATGVDYISSGALTHSVTALDISLLLD